MKDFFLGFFAALSLGFCMYIVWEHYRHIPIMIKEVPVPMQSIQKQSDSQWTFKTE